LSLAGQGESPFTWREIPLNETDRKVLADNLAAVAGEWPFHGRKGQMTTRTAERVLMKYDRLAGAEATPHQLRHYEKRLIMKRSVPQMA